MYFECTPKDLLFALNIVSHTVSEHYTIPILSYMLLETEGKDHLIISATDLKISVKVRVKAQIQMSGQTTLPAKILTQITKELPNEPIFFKQKSTDLLQIDCASSSFNVSTLPKDEFPPIVFWEEHAISVCQQDLKKALQQTVISISTDNSRQTSMSGVFFECTHDSILFVATDGKRLSHVTIPAKTGIPEDSKKTGILPGKISQELCKNLGKDDFVDIIVGNKEIIFHMGEVSYMCQLIDERFPNFLGVIQKPIKNSIKLNRQAFVGALRRSSVMVDDKINRIKIDIIKGKMVITSGNDNFGASEEFIEIDYDGESLAIGFAPVYLLEGLKVMTSEEITFDLTEREESAILRESDDFLYLVMPMILT
ncbi:DNA polymerase III subunit beta [PVC group bacterium (ex Bugula neritina AB1)]|nr:DNA polymerase III subunit beta [PVC group bacterium (ex Bugula neritina AB1)]